MSPQKPAKEPPRRVRFTVPAADVSVLDWIDAQSDASVSLRMVIREHITREGYVDVACRPVAQQPRRGRPPTEQSAAGDEPWALGTGDAGVDQGRGRDAASSVQQPSSLPSATSNGSHRVVQADGAGTDRDTAGGDDGSQVDINDLFAH